MNKSMMYIPRFSRPGGLVRLLGLALLAALVTAAVPTAARAAAPPAGHVAAEGEELAAVLVDEAAIRFAPKLDADRWLLQVIGSDGVVLRRELDAADIADLAIPRTGEGALAPGHYTYALHAMRAAGAGRRVQAGAFVLTAAGARVVSAGEEPAAGLSERLGAVLGGASAPTAFDFVINDDLVVTGSTCIGFDCFNNVGFDFTTLGLAENNLRITFHDTSTAASFPRNDWQLEANSSANGGSNHFAILDCGPNGAVGSCPLSRRVFLVEAGAPVDSLRVDNSGRLGIRTANPVLEIHVNDSDTPSMRLEQNTTGGWPAQTWDVAGNETNFFVRDVNAGSTLPFRIRPGAPSNMVNINTNGVAMGKASADAQLDIQSGAADRVALNVNTATSSSAAGAVFRYGGTAHVSVFLNGLRQRALSANPFDNGAGDGNFVFMDRNNNASTPAAGFYGMRDKGGTGYYIWADDTGVLRINNLSPTNANDTAGTVVGTQTSWFESKNELARWDFRGALQDVVELPLYSFRFADDSQRGDKLNRGLVVFERDRDAWWVMNAASNQTPVLDEANLFGRLIGAIKELDGKTGALEAELAAKDDAIDELSRRIAALEAALQRLAPGAVPSTGRRADARQSSAFGRNR